MIPPEPIGPAALLVARDIVRNHGPTRALRGADLTLQEREIHALVGPSGAGKTTLIDTLTGLDRFDTGAVTFRGYPIRLRSRRDASRVGIAVVAQQRSIVPALSVLDNLVMPTWGRLGRPEPADLRKRAGLILSGLGYAGPPDLGAPAAALSPAQARLVQIARALVARAKLYVFDEPFAGLGTRDIDTVIGVMTRLRLSGCGILVATRALDEVLPFADRITVLSEGRTTAFSQPAGNADRGRLLAAMGAGAHGGAPPAAASDRAGAPRTARLVVRAMGAVPAGGGVSLEVAGGEVRALAGLDTAGLTLVLETVAGLCRRTTGTVAIDGRTLPPAAAIATRRAGLAYVPAGGRLPLPAASAHANLRLTPSGTAGAWPLAELSRSLDLSAPMLDTPADRQSVGVRQRIALLRGLSAARTVLVVDEPTRGLGLAERQAVLETLRAAAARGLAILATLSDPPEMLALADSVTVMRGGRSVGEMPAALLDGEALALLAAPPAAFARSTTLLGDLTRENGGAAFWGLRRERHLLCLNTAIADADADPGLAAGHACPFDATRIPEALARGAAEFVAEPDGRRTVLVPIHTRRGNPMGVIGLTLSAAGPPPPAAAVAFHIERLAASL